jgi:hypothetical protein
MFMKLGKLLAAGKSFFGADPMAAYRLNKRACLPKFNEGRNPFAGKSPAPAAEKTAPTSPTSPTAVTAAVKSAEIAVAPKVPALAPAPRYARPPKAVKDVAPVLDKTIKPGWATRLNPFRAPEADSAAARPAVQPEFSLDSVKVVHNDLADADVEIVPVKAHAEVAAPMLPPARQAWEYLGENILKAG